MRKALPRRLRAPCPPLNVVMNLVPAILAAISFILFVSYKLDNKLHAQIIYDLKDRGQYVVEE